jgi:hypothetical protein
MPSFRLLLNEENGKKGKGKKKNAPGVHETCQMRKRDIFGKRICEKKSSAFLTCDVIPLFVF